jgi:hypothetical protein
MDSILDLLKGPEGRQLLEGTSENLGINKADVASTFASAIPILLGAMKNNVSSPDTSGGLLGAIGKHSNDGLLDNISNIFSGSGNMGGILDDGSKILGHLFNGQEEYAAHAISKSNGMDLSSAMKVLKMAAPFVMSYMGKHALKNKISDTNGLSGMLDGILGDQSNESAVIARKVQDYANNNDTPDTISEFITDTVKKSGVIGKLFNDLMN